MQVSLLGKIESKYVSFNQHTSLKMVFQSSEKKLTRSLDFLNSEKKKGFSFLYFFSSI